MQNSFSWIGNWAEKRSELSPEKIAVIDFPNKKKYTYFQLNIRANQCANLLLKHNIKKGDRVAVLSKNRLELIDLFLATGKIGAILTPLNIRLSIRELEYLIQKTQPKILLYDHSCNEKAEDIKRKNSIENFVNFDKEDNTENSYTFLLNSADKMFKRSWDISFKDPHLILFTGGTTGLPKGAVLSHKLIFWNSINTITSWGLYPNDIQPLLFPLFHTGGWNVLFVPFYHLGATTILMGDFNSEETLEVISKEKCSIVIGVPTIFQMIAESKNFNSTSFDSVRIFISGGAPCPLSIMEKYWKRGKDFKMGYGLTEVGPNNFYLPEHDIHRKPLSVGFPVFHCDMKLVDDDNNIVGVNEVGELCLRGPHVFSGYWNDHEETNKTIDPDGWIHTGDLARKDEEGFYYIIDRKKNMFISGGENIFPVEVEEALYSHPEVLEAIVFGVPDDKWGEVGVAAIATKTGREIPKEEILEFLQDKLARYKQPKHFIFYKELPKSAAGKILRRELKNEYKPY
ncbi:MAG: long-chain fatty acid--CoA ligase [Candidatus Thorarchaeota archaeon]